MTYVPVLYLDLDGTVRWGKDELGRFVNGPGDVRVFDEVPELLARYKACGWRIIGISNQGGIALGIVERADVEAAVVATHRQSGHAFDDILYCVHHPNAAEPSAAICWCRKPRAGMVVHAAINLVRKHPEEKYPPHLGLLVGDRDEDRGCAEAANLRFLDAAAWRAGEHRIEP